MIEWKTVSSLEPKFGKSYLLCNKPSGWVRFGWWYPEQKEWYYSATNERTQFAQVKGDEPTHWSEVNFPPVRSRGP